MRVDFSSQTNRQNHWVRRRNVDAMKIASIAAIAVIAAASVARCADLCSSCRCTAITVSPNEEELSDMRDYKVDDLSDWSPIQFARDPAGKFLDVACSSSGADWEWPSVGISGVCVSFEGNDLKKVPEFPDKVKRNMLKLLLGRNEISEIAPGDFDDYQRVRVLDLSSNRIRHIGEMSFSKMGKLSKLDLSGNRIADFGTWLTDAVKYLDVSRNQISHVESEICKGSKSLKLLNLSGNKLNALPDDFGRLFPNLKFLYLMGNMFEKLPRLPKSLVSLNISSNTLNTLALPQTDNLLLLDVSNNSLGDLEGLDRQLALEVFKANHNYLSKFVKLSNYNLKVLDLAYNNLKIIPREINSDNLPHLQELYLDGNPINELGYNEEAKPFTDLNVLGLSNLGNVKTIEREAFAGIITQSYINCSEERGLFIDLSKNKLKNVELNTFKTFPICSIDLSGNHLTYIPENLLSWSDLRSADLQNNPWNCICDLQWMIDIYVPHFYKIQPETLFNLRCSSPSRFKNKMFAYWYNVTTDVFCTGGSYYQYEYSSGKYIEIRTMNLIISIILGVLIVVLIIVIAVLLLARRGRTKGTKAQEKQKGKRSKPLFLGKNPKYNEISQDATF